MAFDISKIDFIGARPALFTRNSSWHQSNIGGLMTIGLFVVTILCFIGFGLDIVQRKRPQVYNSKEINNMNILQKNNETIFAFAPMFRGGKKIEDLSRKLIPQVSYVEVSAGKQTNYTTVPLIPCMETEVFKTNFLNVTSKVLVGKAETYLCLSDTFDRPWMGKFGNGISNYYEFYFKRCKNNTENKDGCLPREVVDEELEEFYAQFIFLDHYLDARDFNQPFKPLVNSDILQMSSQNARTDDYYMKMYDMETDIGWVMEQEYVTTSFIKESSSTLIFDKNSDFFWDLRVSVSNLREIYNRKYIKLQGIFAVAGGFLKVILIIVCVVNNYLTGLVFYDDILQQSFKNYKLTLMKSKKISEMMESPPQGHTRQQSNSTEKKELKVSTEDMNVQLQELHEKPERPVTLHPLPTTSRRRISGVVKKDTFMSSNIKVKPLTFTDVLCYYCKNPGSSSLRKFETLYEDVMDVNRIFFSLNKLEMLEKIMFPDREQRYLKRVAVHKNIISKIAISDDHLEENEVDENKFEKILQTAKTKNDAGDRISKNLIENFE